MGTARKLIKGSIFRNVELVVLLGVTFFITPFIVHSLGNRMYGFWTLLGTFIGYYGLMDFGLSTAAARFISHSVGQNDAEEIGRVANTAFFLFSLIGAAAFLATILFAAACPLLVHDAVDLALSRRIILLMGFAVAVGFPVRTYGGILTSYVRYDLISYVSIARIVLSNAAIYYYLGKGCGIMAVAVISFISSLAQSAATYGVCKYHYPDIRIHFLRFDRTKIREMFDYSWLTFVCQLGDLLRFHVDSLVIAGFLNVGLVTYYSLGIRLVDGFSKVVMSSVGMMKPVFSQLEGRGDYDGIKSALLKVTKLSALLSAFIGLSVIFYAKAFILRWMGPGYERSYYVAAICCAAFIIELPQFPGIELLFGLSKHKYYAVLNGVEAVLNVLLSVILLKYYGLYGVVLGTAAEILIIKLFVLPVYICRTIRMKVREYLFETILLTLIKSAVPLGLYFYFIRDLVLPDYTRLVLCVAGQTLLFIPAAYFFILNQSERALMNRALRFEKVWAALGSRDRPAAEAS